MWRSVISVVTVAILVASCSGSSGGQQPGSTYSLRAVDGGADYYGRFSPSLPSDSSFFPIGVWLESVVDESGWPVDKGAGVNTYVEPTANSDLSTIARVGMYALTSRTDAGANGRVTSDEVDMWAGPGSDGWTGNYPGQGDICIPASGRCGYTVMETLAQSSDRNRLTYTNYGKGVLFWETDAEAARFVNDYQDVVSADAYWFTDPYICGPGEGGGLLAGGLPLTEDRCRQASNYGATVDRVRSLVEPAGSKPVWSFVELGHPFTEAEAPTITPRQVVGAVWSSILHGARGIVYFNHSFGGSCQTQHVLRDCGPEMQQTLQQVNGTVTALAPVLNAPFVDGLVTPDPRLDVMAKYYQDELYVLAMPLSGPLSDAGVNVGCTTSDTVEVVGENRTVPMSGGRFVDSFYDGSTMHVYKVPGVSGCISDPIL